MGRTYSYGGLVPYIECLNNFSLNPIRLDCYPCFEYEETESERIINSAKVAQLVGGPYL
jgi:hypothetical protein